METMDLIIIGAGVYGLSMAKTYREVNPTAKVLVVESAETIGGTWAKHRLYPGLKSNHLFGTYEFSDFPMDLATYGVKPGQFMPGNVIHQYLRDYAEHSNVYQLIRFGVTVEKVERGADEGWILTTRSTGSAKPDLSSLRTKKLVIATGLTSSPTLPSIPGSSTFNSPLFHSKDFLQNASTFNTAKSITILGGAKSAWDVSYEYASRGVHVDMIIRSSGHGPTWMAQPYVTPLKIGLLKMAHIRFLTWFNPCVWGETDGIGGFVRRFLHGTGIGRRIVRMFFAALADDLKTFNAYDKHPETAKLKPWTDTFWIAASGLSSLTYQTDFFEFVRNGMINVHIADITHLSPKTVHLDTGVELPADAFICATGWKYKPPVEFVPESLQASLGLPSAFDKDSKLTQKVDAEVLNSLPILKDQPPPNSSYKPLSTTDSTYSLSPTTPYRLYRFMAPPAFMEDRNIAFAGTILSVSTTLIAQTQALWITAYFSQKGNNSSGLAIPNSEQAMHDTLLHTEFCKLRYPQGFTTRFPDFVYDGVPYLDLLLKDLGLSGKRKAWWKEVWEPYGPEDYKGLVGEWVAKRG